MPALRLDELKAVPKIYAMVLEGSTRADIEEAAPQLFPRMNVARLLDHAMQSFADVADQPTDVIGGWCLESSRDLYRKMVEVGDYDGALRAVKQVTEVVKFIQDQRSRTIVEIG